MAKENGLLEIRWHGRGGQGAVTSAELLAQAAISEGKFAQAFNRIDLKKPVRIRTDITTPDIVIVLDPSLLEKVNVTSGLKKGGFVIVNTVRTMEEIKSMFGIKNPLATVDATKIARDKLGVPIVNTTMLGAVIRATGVVDRKSVEAPLEHRFGRLGERNIEAMNTAYKEVHIEEQ
jgi:pyruvate ferredoxin oxidoreductase gamma subunit